MTLKELSVLYIIKVCKGCEWDRREAAKILGISERSIRGQLKLARELGMVTGCPCGRYSLPKSIDRIVAEAERERERLLDLMDGHFKRKYKVRGV